MNKKDIIYIIKNIRNAWMSDYENAEDESMHLSEPEEFVDNYCDRLINCIKGFNID